MKKFKEKFNEVCEIATVIIIVVLILIGVVWGKYIYQKTVIKNAIEESKTEQK